MFCWGVQVSQVPEASEGIFGRSLYLVAFNEPVKSKDKKIMNLHPYINLKTNKQTNKKNPAPKEITPCFQILDVIFL